MDLLSNVEIIYADGFTKESLLKWGLAQNKEAQKTNCRLYEARKLNDKDSTEAYPFYCIPFDSTPTAIESSDSNETIKEK